MALSDKLSHELICNLFLTTPQADGVLNPRFAIKCLSLDFSLILGKQQALNIELAEIRLEQKRKTEPKKEVLTLSGSKQKEGISYSVAELKTIRGGFHNNFFRIVFQFSEDFTYEKPIIDKNQALIHLHHIKTQLNSFRKYRSFNAWVFLEESGENLNIRIGLPEKILQFSCFDLKDPNRLVVDAFIQK